MRHNGEVEVSREGGRQERRQRGQWTRRGEVTTEVERDLLLLAFSTKNLNLGLHQVPQREDLTPPPKKVPHKQEEHLNPEPGSGLDPLLAQQEPDRNPKGTSSGQK